MKDIIMAQFIKIDRSFVIENKDYYEMYLNNRYFNRIVDILHYEGLNKEGLIDILFKLCKENEELHTHYVNPAVEKRKEQK